MKLLSYLLVIIFALIPLFLAFYWVRRRSVKQDSNSVGSGLSKKVEIAGNAVTSVSTLYGSAAAGQSVHFSLLDGSASTSEVYDPGLPPLVEEDNKSKKQA